MRATVVALLALLALAGAALAAQPRASFNDVEDEVMCDTCNVPLNIAESDRAELERTYGPGILAKPQDSGFSLAVWWVPVAVVAGLVALLAALLPRWRRRGGGDGDDDGGHPPPPALSTADERRLDEDLARYDV